MLGYYNPTVAVKNLSANFDWKDKSEVDQTIKAEINNLSEMPTSDLLRIANDV
jgi:hypothetical protein